MPTQNTIESAIQTQVQISDSRTRTTCAFRWKTPRSRASINSTKMVKPIHRAGVPTLVGVIARQCRPRTLRVPLPRPLLAGPLVHLGAEAVVLRAELGGVFLAEVLRLEDGADLQLRLLVRHRVGAAPD